MSTPLNASVLKAFGILELFTPERVELSAGDVARGAGISTATAHRFLLTLEQAGALTSTRRGQFRLGAKLRDLGRLAEASDPLAERAQPVITALARTLGESVMVCRLGRGGPQCIAVARADRPISVDIEVGTTLDMVSSAQGKLFLAHMAAPDRARWTGDADIPGADAIRASGIAQNRGEVEADIAAIAMPLFDVTGAVQATMSIFGLLSRFDTDFVTRATTALRTAIQELAPLP